MPTAERAPTTSGGDPIARLRAHRVTTVADLHAINGEPRRRFLEKHTSYLTPLLESFITAAPFFLIATSDADGNCDVSPKGDPAGSVRILDRRIDGHRNIVANPHVGLIFIIPNVDETVRLNGRAFLTADPDLLAAMTVQNKAPKLATIVEIDEVYMHCAVVPPLHSPENGVLSGRGCGQARST